MWCLSTTFIFISVVFSFFKHRCVHSYRNVLQYTNNGAKSLCLFFHAPTRTYQMFFSFLKIDNSKTDHFFIIKMTHVGLDDNPFPTIIFDD